MNYIATILFAIVLAITCSPAHSKELVNISDLPGWFQKSMAKEIKLKKKSQLKIKELNVDTSIAGKISASQSQDNFWYYQIDIGSSTPLECYAFSTFDGPANSLQSVIDNTFPGIEQLNGKKLSSRFIYEIDNGIIGLTPYLRLDTLYTVGEGNGKSVGLLKAISAKTGDTLQICLHNEPGYKEAFQQVASSFIGAFPETQSDSGFYVASHSIQINGIPAGYSREIYIKDQDGYIQTIVESSLLMPVNNSTVSKSDNVLTEWSRSNGSVINVQSYSIKDGAYSFFVNLQTDGEKWTVSGESQGKTLEATLEHDSWLMSSYGTYLATSKLLSSDESSSSFIGWSADADPTTALPIVIEKIQKNAEQANVRIDIGPLSMQARADKNGTIKQGSLKIGPLTMEIQRLAEKGSL